VAEFTVTCSCGVILGDRELEAHIATHGIEADTYRAALVRAFLEAARDNDETAPRPKPEGGEVSRETRES
jgi:hypothetical protein